MLEGLYSVVFLLGPNEGQLTRNAIKGERDEPPKGIQQSHQPPKIGHEASHNGPISLLVVTIQLVGLGSHGPTMTNYRESIMRGNHFLHDLNKTKSSYTISLAMKVGHNHPLTLQPRPNVTCINGKFYGEVIQLTSLAKSLIWPMRK